ncbi:MAG: DUF512 domain-containing protein [Eggerthellaceae bacterium]|nr:DUF512 domain-containing protein [Eggerthellaceae bacterium]
MTRSFSSSGSSVAHGAAHIIEVCPKSPADDAGFCAGCALVSVDGHPLRDVIDWQWHASAESIELVYVDTFGEEGSITLEREAGEPWGFVFDGVVFDEVKTCKNACTFCFMQQLPCGMRPSLYLRDDDFRLSFTQGTFITCSNMSAEDEARIIEQSISPLRVSLHAISPDVRKALIGKHAARGLEACERLLAAGIKMHMQIVLVPGVNDGEELHRTLAWAYEHSGIVNIAVVPLGFTKHQTRFTQSFDDAYAAQQVLDDLGLFQARAYAERGNAWVYAADEFYCNAHPHDLLDYLPAQDFYGDFDLFEDGVGMLRATLDAWEASAQAVDALAKKLRAANKTVYFVAGYAQEAFFEPLLAKTSLHGLLIPLFVHNDFFGGNVNVTGLLTATDILKTLKDSQQAGQTASQTAPQQAGQTASQTAPQTAPQQAGQTAPQFASQIPSLVVLPRVIFNDEGLTLDDMSLEDMRAQSVSPLAVVSCNPTDYLKEIAALIS